MLALEHTGAVGIIAGFQENPLQTVLYFVALFTSVILHEYGHAWAAILMGDPTPTHNGRFVWNPLKYLDLFGILMFLLVGFGGLGYVMTRPELYRNRKLGEVLVSSAGVIMNLVLVVLSALVLNALHGGALSGLKAPDWVYTFLDALFYSNVILAVFNALPIPPLDGARLLSAIVPGSLGQSLRAHLNTPSSSLLLLVFIVVLNQPISQFLHQALLFAARVLP